MLQISLHAERGDFDEFCLFFFFFSGELEFIQRMHVTIKLPQTPDTVDYSVQFGELAITACPLFMAVILSIWH